MVYNKVIAPNKVIFSNFDFSYENQIIIENSCILNVFIRKVKITKYDFVRSYDFVVYDDGI